jgi:RND family efflux transporter MFP subunit
VKASAGERAIVFLGLVPLAAAAIWLIVLREPHTAVASTRLSQARSVEQYQLPAPLLRFVGVVVAGQDAELGAELGGEVVRAFKESGERVHRGEPLLQLAALSVVGARNMAVAQGVEDRSALLAAKLELENARDKAERMQNAPNAYSTRDVQSARADAARAAAGVDKLRGTAAVHRAGLERELARAAKQLVRAPFDGVLSARFLDVGDFVGAGQPLARVVDDTRFVRFALPAHLHARIQPGVSVSVLPNGSDLPLPAAVVDVDPELDAAAGMGFVRARLPEAASGTRFMPGTRVEVSWDAASATLGGAR